jgi:hypothetical protein
VKRQPKSDRKRAKTANDSNYRKEANTKLTKEVPKVSENEAKSIANRDKVHLLKKCIYDLKNNIQRIVKGHYTLSSSSLTSSLSKNIIHDIIDTIDYSDNQRIDILKNVLLFIKYTMNIIDIQWSGDRDHFNTIHYYNITHNIVYIA